LELYYCPILVHSAVRTLLANFPAPVVSHVEICKLLFVRVSIFQL